MFLNIFENVKSILNKNNGFTLIELIVAMMLLGIIIAAFTPLLLISYKNIVDSGERSSSLYDAAGEMEKRLAEEMVIGEGIVDVEFQNENEEDGIIFQMEGGMIIESHDLESFLETFLTNVPTMSISPYEFNEGYTTDFYIDVTGNKTNFDPSHSSVRIIDADGISVPGSFYSQNLVNHVSETETGIRLTGQLNNASGPYKVEIETALTEGTEIVRAEFTVYLPGVMIVGENGVFISSGSVAGLENWHQKNSNGDYSGVAWGSTSYVAAGLNGQIGRITDGSEWDTISGVTGDNFNSIYRATPSPGRFIAVGDNGTAYHSSDGRYWEAEEVTAGISIDTVNFRDLVLGSEEDDMLVLVGEENGTGVIIFVEEEVEDEDDFGKINTLNGSSFPALNGVTWGSDGEDIKCFVAVGEDGLILYSIDAENWDEAEDNNLPGETLNAVTWGGSSFVAVGENGVILNSDDGENWDEIEDNNLPGENLNAVTWSGSLFVAVGDNGVLLTSGDGENWTAPANTGLNGDLHEIVFR